MAIARIKYLTLETIIGANDWERNTKQKVVINVEYEFSASKAVESDDLNDTCDYKKITKRIIDGVERSSFHLLEKLAAYVLSIVMEDPKVKAAKVEIDKPGALRYSDSVSVEVSAKK